MGFLRGRKQAKRIRVPVVRNCFSLLKRLINKGGRNNTGRLVLLHRGGALLNKYRIIDFRKIFWNLGSIVLYNEYDPNRTSLITLICYYNGILSYVLSTFGIFTGNHLFTGNKTSFLREGNTVPLIIIPEGTMIHSIEISAGVGGQFVRSAGTFALLVKKFFTEGKALIRLPSKEEILLDLFCIATIGQVSRYKHMLHFLYKAGQNRYKGWRPSVRGVAKNPVDHPHGGGGGRCLVTPWSKVAKNLPTRKLKKKKRSNSIIVLSRKKNKYR